MKEIRYYFDMDGVLAKWNPDASEEETHVPGYFFAREIELAVVALVNKLSENGREVCILSSVYEDNHSAFEKRSWLNAVGLTSIKEIFVPYGKDKCEYINDQGIYLPVLIDDYSKNLYAWEKKGYLPIKFFNGFNNQPKITLIGDNIKVKTDGWSGYSIDHRMSVEQMYTVLTAISEAEANNACA